MRISQFIICVLSVSIAFFQVGPAFAGIIGTDKTFNEFSTQNDRAKLKTLIARDEVRGLLASNGLTVEQAQQRVNALTDKEAKQLAEKFDEQAAGGVLIALLIIFLVFIILELAGVTDIFTGI